MEDVRAALTRLDRIREGIDFRELTRIRAARACGESAWPPGP
ncbi:hypothetical protein [Streptomyces sp. NPDC050504]